LFGFLIQLFSRLANFRFGALASDAKLFDFGLLRTQLGPQLAGPSALLVGFPA